MASRRAVRRAAAGARRRTWHGEAYRPDPGGHGVAIATVPNVQPGAQRDWQIMLMCECGWRVFLGADVSTVDYLAEVAGKHRARPSAPATGAALRSLADLPGGELAERNEA